MRGHPLAWDEVEVLIFDFDGTIASDQKLWTEEGITGKLFSGRDGAGLAMLRRKLHMPIHVISNENNPVTRKYCEVQGLVFHYCSVGQYKDVILRQICADMGISPARACFVGDDTTDCSAMSAAGIGVAVADAHTRLWKYYHTKAAGGAGAVREVCDNIIRAQRGRLVIPMPTKQLSEGEA